MCLFVHTKRGVNVAKNVIEWDGDVEQEDDDDEDCMVHDKGNGGEKGSQDLVLASVLKEGKSVGFWI